MSKNTEFKAVNTPFDFTRYNDPYEIDRIKLLLDKFPVGHGKAMDIGCGPGYFSRELSNRGWAVTGVDTDSTNIEMAKEHTAETLLGDCITIMKSIQDAQYDLIISLEVIEHMPKEYGVEMIRQISRILKPGGKLLISTPNRMSPEGLYDYYWREKFRGERKWLAWEPTHIYIYSAFEIIKILRSNNLTIGKQTGYYYKGQLPMKLKWRLPINRSSTFPINRFGFNVIMECHKE